jgi:hypothetical protein
MSSRSYSASLTKLRYHGEQDADAAGQFVDRAKAATNRKMPA